MLTANDLTHTLATFAGVHQINVGTGRTCDERNAGDRCGRDAVAIDRVAPGTNEYLCAGHLKLAAAEALTVDAWDVNGVRA